MGKHAPKVRPESLIGGSAEGAEDGPTDRLARRPDHALVGVIRMPSSPPARSARSRVASWAPRWLWRWPWSSCISNESGTRSDLLRQSGADSVVVSSETSGRLLGTAMSTPSVVEMFEDLLTPDTGFAISEREVEFSEVGGSPRQLPDIVLGIVRGGRLYRVGAPEADAAERGDRLLYVKKVIPAPRESR